MCGIVGLIQTRSGPFPRDILDRMNSLLVHRGPDEEGAWVEGNVGLAQRRLSVIDLETGRQPLCNEDGSLWIVYNGEVYNYIELRAALEQRGHRFRTRSDTEVIVHLYEEKGPACLQDLRGMFAFAIWNRNDRSLFLARDRLGIKPLFYASTPGAFLFASEIKSLLVHPDMDRAVDRAALLDYLTYRYVSAPGTLFTNVRKLRPGHYLTLQDGGEVRETCYWDVFGLGESPDPDPALEDRNECTHRLRELLQESVRLRLRSDVPLGAFLSGGVDSTVLVGIMSGLMERPVETFSVGFDDPEFNELPYAREVSRRFGTIHREVLLKPQDIPAHLPSLIWYRDAPVSEPTDVALYLVSRLARESVKVVLSGEGADELFAGYAKYVLEPFSGLYQRIPQWLETTFIHRPVQGLPFIPRQLKSAVRSLRIRDETERFASYFASLDLSERARVLSADFLETVRPGHRLEAFPEGNPARLDRLSPVERMFYVDMKHWLPDNLLERGDRMTMAASIEGRVPLLDHKLVEFASRIPMRWKRRGLRTKLNLKESMADLLPDSVLHRRKVGFTVPVRTWFRNELREWVTDILCDETTRNRGIFRHDEVRAILDRHMSGKGDYYKQIWMLINLELWFRQSTGAHTAQ